MLLAKLTKLSCSMTKPEEKSLSIKANNRAEYGSATDLFQYKNPIRESKKHCKVTEKANQKPSSIWNGPVGNNQRVPSIPQRQFLQAMNQVPHQGYLVNLFVGILLLVVLIAFMVLDINAKVSKFLQ